MDCKAAQQLLEYFRPPHHTDLAAEDVDALEKHLAVCVECDETARAERRLDHHLGKAVRNVAIPHKLKDRFLQRLASDRRDRFRRTITRVASGAVAATLLFLLLGWALFVGHEKGPQIDQEQVCIEMMTRLGQQGPNDLSASFSTEHADLQAPPPEQMDPRLLVSHTMTSLYDQLIPVYTYRNHDGTGVAIVYVLPERQFNLSQVKQSYVHPSGRLYQVRILREPRYAYVVAHTKDLSGFLKRTGDPAS